jgi:hypothetical protein
MSVIDDLLTPVTADEQLESFLATLEALGLPARSWRSGGVYRTILRVVAEQYSAFSFAAVEVVASNFLETASGGWLTRLAASTFGVTRNPATFATGFITLTNSGGGIYSLATGQIRVECVTTGKSYTNQSPIALAALSTLTGVAVIAVEQGAESTAAPATVTRVVTVLPGVASSNPAAIVGQDAETDDSLRARCNASRAAGGVYGPRSIYAYAARTAKRLDGSPVDVTRVRVAADPLTGIVSVVVASASGSPTPTDLQAVRDSVEAIARPDSVTATVAGAIATPVTATIIVWARRIDGVSAADLATRVQTALATMIASYPIGGIAKPTSTQGYLYADNIAGTSRSADNSIFDIDYTGGDLAIPANGVAVFAATVDVRLVAVAT